MCIYLTNFYGDDLNNQIDINAVTFGYKQIARILGTKADIRGPDRYFLFAVR